MRVRVRVRARDRARVRARVIFRVSPHPHLEQVVDMEQGHVTFRPGSARHAGAAISGGLRYIIGGFIAVDDRIEHVRRLNDRGNRMVV